MGLLKVSTLALISEFLGPREDDLITYPVSLTSSLDRLCLKIFESPALLIQSLDSVNSDFFHIDIRG